MNKIQNFFREHKIESDELGRMIIHDQHIMEKINGAIFSDPAFIVPDTACGNGNCVC